MRACRRTLGLLEVLVSLAVVGCKGTLPESGTGGGEWARAERPAPVASP